MIVHCSSLPLIMSGQFALVRRLMAMERDDPARIPLLANAMFDCAPLELAWSMYLGQLLEPPIIECLRRAFGKHDLTLDPLSATNEAHKRTFQLTDDIQLVGTPDAILRGPYQDPVPLDLKVATTNSSPMVLARRYAGQLLGYSILTNDGLTPAGLTHEAYLAIFYRDASVSKRKPRPFLRVFHVTYGRSAPETLVTQLRVWHAHPDLEQGEQVIFPLELHELEWEFSPPNLGDFA